MDTLSQESLVLKQNNCLLSSAALIGRISAAAQQAKAPFHNLDVSPGQYELSTAAPYEAPSLQVPWGLPYPPDVLLTPQRVHMWHILSEHA